MTILVVVGDAEAVDCAVLVVADLVALVDAVADVIVVVAAVVDIVPVVADAAAAAVVDDGVAGVTDCVVLFAGVGIAVVFRVVAAAADVVAAVVVAGVVDNWVARLGVVAVVDVCC